MQTFQLLVEPRRNNEMALTLLMDPISRDKRRRRRNGKPEKVVTIWGNPLATAFPTIHQLIRTEGYRPSDLRPGRRTTLKLKEDSGIRLGLLMKAIKPLRKLDRVQAVIEGVEGMSREEASYWFSKAINSPHDAERRRAMKAMRILLAKE